MSLWDDYKADAQFEHDFPFGVPSDTWHSRSGDIKLVEMTDEHIRNCMNLVGEDDKWYFVFQKELERRNAQKHLNHIPPMNRDYVIVCNEHQSFYPGTLLFWGQRTMDNEPRSFGGYTCDVTRCERYTREELEKWRGDLKKEYPFFDELTAVSPSVFRKHNEVLVSLDDLLRLGLKQFHVIGW